MAIGTAAALIGSAVIGAGASALSSSSAASKAKDAATYAADQNAQVNREIYTQTRGDLAPYNQAGQAGLAALTARLGIDGAATQPAAGTTQGSTPATPAGPQVDTAAFLKSNPDVVAYWNQTPEAQKEPLESFGARVAVEQADVRGPPPMLPAAAAPGPTGRPEATPPPTYERAASGAAPDLASFIDPSKFEFDPGYQTRLKAGLDSVNAASAVRGKLRSGDAAMALQAKGDGLAAQGYSDWYNRQLAGFDRVNSQYQYGQDRQDRNFVDDRSYGTNLWNNQQTRTDNIFSDDRGYATDREDQATSNLFGLVGVGQNAAAGTASAGNVFARNQIDSNNQRASTTANAAIANAQNTSNLFGSAANAVGTYYGMKGRI